MEKETIKELIFSKHFSGHPYIRFSEFPNNIKPDNFISIHREEAHYSENSSYDAYTVISIHRERLETDEEFEKRKQHFENLKKESRDKRYKTYLKLKKEFESK